MALAAEVRLKPTRLISPRGTYFVTATTWGRRPIFLAEPLAKLFLRVIFEYRDAGQFQLHDFVLMPEHFHLLLTPAQTLEHSLQVIKGGYSYRVRKELGIGIEVWQRGFTDHRIRDRGDFERHRAYIYRNPVTRGLVIAAQDYAFCSAYPGSKLDSWPSAAEAGRDTGMLRHG